MAYCGTYISSSFFFEPIRTAFNHIALNESFKMDYKEILPQE